MKQAGCVIINKTLRPVLNVFGSPRVRQQPGHAWVGRIAQSHAAASAAPRGCPQPGRHPLTVPMLSTTRVTMRALSLVRVPMSAWP